MAALSSRRVRRSLILIEPKKEKGMTMVKVEKTWEDQPNEVLDVPIILSVSIPNGVAEIRMLESGACYLTCGTLFGSQTVACDTLEIAVRALHCIANRSRRRRGGDELSVPEGVKLIANVARSTVQS